MPSVAKALGVILEVISPLASEHVPLWQALGRVLAEETAARINIPPFDRSRLDGYACRAKDTEKNCLSLPARLKVIATIGAGEKFAGRLTPGTCVRIMTGAKMPDGADAVVAAEKTGMDGDAVLVASKLQQGENVSKSGEDITIGRSLMMPGAVLGAAQLGVLSAAGHQSAVVYRRPRTAVLATGSELTPAGETLPDGHIYDSNSVMTGALVVEHGGLLTKKYTVPDHLHDITNALSCALSAADMVITTGGVQAGDFDLTRQAVEAVGSTVLFHGLSVKPGAGMLAALSSEKKLILSLSGNPAAVYANFHLFAKPALYRLAGRAASHIFVRAQLEHDLKDAGPEQKYIRSILSCSAGQWTVSAAGSGRAGVFSSLMQTNSLISLPAARNPLRAGETVDVLPISFSL